MKARLSSFREVRPGCQKSSPSFLHLEKSGCLFLSLLASVQAALQRDRHCRLADGNYDKITFLSLASAAESKSNYAPSFLLSFSSFFMYFCRSGKSAPKSTESCCLQCSGSFCLQPTHFVARNLLCVILPSCLIHIGVGGKFHVPLNRVPHASASSGLNSAPCSYLSVCWPRSLAMACSRLIMAFRDAAKSEEEEGKVINAVMMHKTRAFFSPRPYTVTP